MELVKIEAKDFGLKESKAKEISDMFKPMLDKMVDLEKEFNGVVDLPIDENTVKIAKALRLKFVKVRTGTDTIHKELKKFYIMGGKFVDGWKNAQLMASQGLEQKLMEIEKYYEKKEAEKVEKIRVLRENKLLKFGAEVFPSGLGDMEDDVWSNYLTGVQAGYEAKLEADKKVEEARLETVRKETEERERVRLENEKLKAEAVEKDRLAKIEEEKRAKAEKVRIAKEAVEEKKRLAEIEKARKIAEVEKAKLEAEKEKLRKDAEEKARTEKEKQDAILVKERETQAKLRAELEAKEAVEEKAKADEEAKIQSDLNKGDALKFKDLLADLDDLKTRYSFKSAKNKKMYKDVSVLLDKVITHIKG